MAETRNKIAWIKVGLLQDNYDEPVAIQFTEPDRFERMQYNFIRVVVMPLPEEDA